MNWKRQYSTVRIQGFLSLVANLKARDLVFLDSEYRVPLIVTISFWVKQFETISNVLALRHKFYINIPAYLLSDGEKKILRYVPLFLRQNIIE